MGRKNDRALRRGRARRADPGVVLPAKPNRRPIELLTAVPVAGRCPKGKLRYADEKIANAALKLVRKDRARKGATIIEKRVYRHALCGGWHLTHLDINEGTDAV